MFHSEDEKIFPILNQNLISNENEIRKTMPK